MMINKTKEEIIKDAWILTIGEERYNKIKSEINNDGVYVGDSYALTDEEFENLTFVGRTPHVDNKDYFVSGSQPTELLGIEDNYGWISINTKEDLPKTNNIFLECVSKYNGRQATHHFLIGDEKYMINNFSHYKLMPYNKPLYK